MLVELQHLIEQCRISYRSVSWVGRWVISIRCLQFAHLTPSVPRGIHHVVRSYIMNITFIYD
jgi:hypothetical protein